MTTTDEEIAKALFTAWNARDTETIRSLTSPEIEYVNAPMAVEPGTRRGRDQLAEVFRKQWEGLGSGARVELDAFHPQDADLITTGRVLTNPFGSRAEMANRLALRWTIRDGLVARLEVLGAGSSFGEALGAASIAE